MHQVMQVKQMVRIITLDCKFFSFSISEFPTFFLVTKLAFSNTTGKRIIAECRRLCRVPDHRHSAKRSFAECRRHSTRQTYGTRHDLPLPSADRRQKVTLGIYYLCRVLLSRTRQRRLTCPARAPAVRRPLGVADGR